MIEKLKTKWGITSTRRIWMILLIFSLTGCSILFLKGPVFKLLRIPAEASLALQIPLALLLYQCLLLFFGGLLGEFAFFWEKEKRLVRLLMRPFTRSYR
jgi:hypothetical protein